MHTAQRFWLICLLLGLLWLPGGTSTITHAQNEDYRAQAEALLAEMTIPERVGQVFMVTFIGDVAPNNGDIADLITSYYIGGVSLRRENDNITGFGSAGDVTRQVLLLNNDMQRLALTGISSLPVLETDPLPEEEQVPTPTPAPRQTAVPLLIATTQEGNGYPYSHIQSGLTPLPSLMAIGATWQPDHARNTGAILGQELAALGVNMLFGPALDVLEDPTAASPGDMGVRTFGGDPYWVGEMGRAFITGVHGGSNGRLAVIPKHFPGNGDSDRPVDLEVPTVRKSLEQLKQIELAPFFAVTSRPDSNTIGVADGLLATHIRFQGFQGNIRATTNPVSFDPQALTTLMALPEFADWRTQGGIIVSDALGVRSVERFYDATEQEFPHRRVAKDAFLAGNDLLYLDSFVLGDDDYEAELANIKDTITWFQERYITDQVLQQRVDEAVIRILQLKLALYDGDFSPENVLASPDNLPVSTAENQSAVVDLAQTAVTLISPNPEELAERIPSPPGIDDNLVIFTDVRTSQQCSSCQPTPLIAETALADNIVALYGPEASEQIAPNQIQSYAFTDLADFLIADGPILPPPTPDATAAEAPPEIPTNTTGESAAPTPSPVPTATPPPGYLVQEALQDTDWIIFALLDGSQGFPTLTRFLAERPDLTRDRQIIVFAYNAPYFLDTTEISKLTAYFGVYSHTPAFVDASARALFQELPFSGASPVDIDGISYNLFEQTQPEPDQVIELYLVESSEEIQDNNNQEPQTLFVGDTLRLQTSVIRDHNDNPVPDGTLVQFIQFDRVTGLINIIREVPSEDGVASLDYVLEARTGQFQITAVSGQATLSRAVNIEIQGEAQVAISIPTLVPTPTPMPTPTLAPTPTPIPTPTLAPTTTPDPGPTSDEPAIRIGLSEVSMLVSFFSGLLATVTLGLLIARQRRAPFTRQLRWMLWGLLGALLVYNYFALGLPGTAVFTAIGAWAGLATTLLGGLLGFAIYLGQELRRTRQPD